MPDISTVLNNAVTQAGIAPVTPEELNPLKAVAQAGYEDAASQNTRVGSQTPLFAAEHMTPEQLAAWVGGSARYRAQATHGNNGISIGDAANDALTAAVSPFAQVIPSVVGLVNPDAGAALTRNLHNSFRELNNLHSDVYTDRETAKAARDAITSAANESDYQAEIARGDGSLVSNLQAMGHKIIRNARDSIENNDSVTADGLTASMVGPLLTMAPAAKLVGLGLKGIGGVAGALSGGTIEGGAAAAARLAMPLTIGGEMSVGTDYDTTDKVLNTDPSELQANSPTYRTEYQKAVDSGLDPAAAAEHARNVTAVKAGTTAGAIELPVGALAGKFAEPLFQAPFKAESLGSSVSHLIQGAVDGGVQGGFGAFASNAGQKLYSNENQDLSEGVGEGLGAGVEGSLGAAALTQVPGLAFHAGLKAAKLPIEFATKRLGTLLQNRYDKVLADTEAKSPLSGPNIEEANLNAQSAISNPDIQAHVQDAVNQVKDPEQQSKVADYFQTLINRITLQPGDLEHPVPAVQEALQGSTDRLDALKRVAVLAADTNTSKADRISAGQYLLEQDRQNGKSYTSALRDAIEAVPDDHPALPFMRSLEDVLIKNGSHPEVLKAVKAAAELETGTAHENPDTPEGKQDIHNIISRAETNPESSDLPSVERVLSHAQDGKITLDPGQKGALETARAMLSLAQQRQEAFDKLKMRGRYVSKEIRTGNPEDASKGPSALEHMKGIVSAMKDGNIDLAKERLSDLHDFATHMQNKVSALNTAFEEGHKSLETGVPYQSLRAGTKKWMRAKPENWMYLDPERPSNIANAQRINIDAKTVTGYTNAVHAAYPELASKPLSHVELDPRLTAEPAKELADKFKQQGIGEREIPSVSEGVGKPVEKTVEAPEASQPGENKDTAPAKLDRANKVEPEGKSESSSAVKASEPEKVPEKLTVKSYVDDYIAGKGRNSAEHEQFAANHASEIEAEFQQRKAETDAKGEDNGKVKPTEQPSKETETSSKTEETAPTADREAEPTAEAANNDNAGKSTDSVEAAYPELIKNAAAKVVNWLQKNFTFPKEQRSRIVGDPEPIKNIRTAIKGGKNAIENFINSDLGKKLEPEVSQGFDKLIGATGKAYLTIQDNLEAALKVKLGGKRSVADALTEGNDDYFPVNTMKRFKALNIVEKGPDGKLRYNETLLQSALLAGTHWLITSAQSGRHYDAESLSDMLGVDPLTADKYKEWFNDSHYRADGVEALASNIERFWGLQAKKDAPIGLTRGISEAMAKEVIRGLTEAGLIKEDAEPLQVVSYDGDGKAITTSYSRILPTVDPKIMEQIKSFPDLLDRMVSMKPEPVDYVNQKPTKIDPYQMGNGRLIKNSRQQMQLIENTQNIPFHMEKNMTGFLLHLGKDLAIKMFGYDTTNPDLNVNDLKSREGYNLTITSAYDYVDSLDAQTRAVNADAPHEVPIHYDYKMSRVGRLFMQGKQNPQSNKLVRAMVLPTRTTLDLSNPDHYKAFMLAAGQHLGLKVHRLGVDGTLDHMSNMFSDLVSGVSDKYQKSFDILNDWASQKDGEPPKLNGDHVATFNEEFGEDLTPEAFHAIMDMARMATDPGAKKFDTSLYLEADGVTDGPINSLMHLSTGGFDTHWVEMMHKGGLFLGSNLRTLADYVNSGIGRDSSTDMYKFTSNILENVLGKTLTNSNEAPEITAQRYALLRTMSGLFGKDMEFDQNYNKLQIDRGIIKNPLTVTVYGSGSRGIAEKLLGEVTDRVYKAISDGKLTPEMINDLKSLTDKVAYPDKDGQFNISNANEHQNTIAPEKDFTFTGDQLTNIRKNIQHLFVRSLNASIDETMGRVNEGKQAVQAATQLQSIFIQHEYRAGIQKAMEAKAAEDPKWTSQIGLSQNELDKIHSDAVDKWHGLIKTPTQTFYPAGNSNADISAPATDDIRDPNKRRDAKGRVEISRSLDDKMSTNLRLNGPGDAGVKGIPYLVIGSGDGQMIQHAFTGDKPLERSLSVFDGINTPLDKIQEYGQRINEAVFKGWIDGDPMKATADSFRAFADTVEKNEVPDFSHKSLESISRVLGMPDPKNKKLLVKLINDHADHIEDLALQNRAMKNVLDKVNLNIDHMAGAESPFTQEGKIDVTGSLEQTAAQLHEMYKDEYNKLKNPDAVDRPLAQEGEEIKPSDQPVKQQIIQGKDLLSYTKDLKLSDDQRSVLEPIARFLAKTGHKLITGSLDQIKEAAIQNGDRFPDQYANVHGYYSDRTKTTYIIDNGSDHSETALHELIHAATLNKVFQFYNGNEHLLASHEREAIQRLDGLMNQFYADSMGRRGGPDENAAVETMLNQIDTEDDGSAEGKAAALNEFMAWSLSNQHLIERGKNSTVWNKAAKIVSDVVSHLKTLLWGNKDAGPKVGDDTFSNLRFNTHILLGSDLPNAAGRMESVVAHQSEFYGTNDRITEIRENMFRKLTAWRDKAETPVEKNTRNNRIDEALSQADGLVHSIDAKGWRLDPQELSTVRMLTAAFMTDIGHNPNTMTRLQTIFAHVLKNLTPEHFMNGDPDDLNDQYWAREKYKMITGGDGTVSDFKGRSSLLPVFLSLAMVHDGFQDVLSKIEPPRGEKSAHTGVDGILNNLGSSSLSALERMLSGEKILSRNVQDSINGLMNKIMEVSEDDHSVIGQFANATGDGVDKTNNYVRDAFQSLYNKGIDKLQGAMDATDNKHAKAILAGARSILSIASNEHAGQVAEGVQAMVTRLKPWRFLQEAVSEFIQRTDSNAPIWDMIKHTKSIASAIRQQFREHLPAVIAKKFSQVLTADEYRHVHEAMLKSDAASLTDYNEASRLKLYSDSDYRQSEIGKYENAIREAQPDNADTLIKRSAELADYMITGNTKNKGNLLKNAYAIAHMLNERLQRKADPNSDIISKIDHLTSLYAIDATSDATKETMAKLVKDEPNGLNFVHNYLVGQRVDELNKALATGRGMFNHTKGYVARQNIEGRSLIVAKDTDFTKLAQLGYVRAGDYVGSNAETTDKMGYYYAKASGKSPFLQGIMQNVRQTAYGVDPRSGFSHGPLTGGRIDDRNEVARIKKAKMLNANSENPLVPVFDGDGSIIAYERSVDPFQESKIKQPDHIGRALGQWRGRQMEESMAQAVNRELISRLHNMWDKDPEKENYVDLLDPKELKKDGVLKDAVDLITPDTYRMIKSTFEGEHFWVRKDLINNAIGYRAPSVADLWTGVSRLDPQVRNGAVKVATALLGINAYKYLRGPENFLQAQVAETKATIIVRSIIVPLMNTVADVVQLSSRGVPIQHIVKGYAKKTTELNNYVKGKLRIDEIEAELRDAVNEPAKARALETERLAITDDWKRMSIWPLIDSGQFSVISTGLTHNAAELTPGAFSLDSWIEKQIDKAPEPMKTLFRYGVVARDTALFQGMERAVEYSDFLGRAVLFDHLKREGKSDKDAIANVTEEFVNYDYLPGRTRTALERYGLTWFWNYKIRSTKVAVNILRNNPLHMLLAGLAPFPHMMGTIGNPLKDNFLAMLLRGKLGHSIGPEMWVRAGHLNPWAHIFGIWIPDI